jgi:hypothetical protein
VTLEERSDLKAHQTGPIHSSYQISPRDSGNNMLLTFELGIKISLYIFNDGIVSHLVYHQGNVTMVLN